MKAGQPMFLIDPVPYQNALAQAKAQLAEQKARVTQTEREENRLRDLLETQAISQREYDNAVSDHAITSAALQQAEVRVRDAELNLSYTKVVAPVTGISGRRQFSEGALVEANSSLLTTLVQLSPIWVRFSLSDNELARIGGPLTESRVQQVTLTLPDGTEYEKKGELNFAASQIDPMWVPSNYAPHSITTIGACCRAVCAGARRYGRARWRFPCAPGRGPDLRSG